MGEMARSLGAQDSVRDGGAAHAAAEAAPAVAAPDSALKFPDGMQPPAAPVKTRGAVNSSVMASSNEMAPVVETPGIAPDAGATHAAAEAAPEVATLDSTLKFPEQMQPPAVPEGEAVKAGVTGEPAATIVGTIEFDVAPALANAGDGKDSARGADAAHAAAEAAPEPEFAAPGLMLEFPDGMQPAAAPGSDADKAAPAAGTIDFEAAPAPAKPDDVKERARDDTTIPVSRKP